MFDRVSLGALVLVVSIANTAAAASPATDLQLQQDVSRAISGCPHLTIFDDVAASVRGGIVTLTGKVTMAHKRDEIQKRVTAVQGVREVLDRIAVLPASPADDALRQRIAGAIYGNVSFWPYAVMPQPPIHIIVEDSHVTLTGVVRSEKDRLLARTLATQVGARSVTNNLRTEPEAPEAP
jgi:osmotically-inducible protein OsmY